KVNFSRPSIDVCMETVAEAFQQRAVGILLSGANADGVKGLLKIKHCGGYTIAQQPATADVDYMPRQAIEKGAVDAVLTPDEIAQFINKG
ncbi:MAG: chemotaxis protein CheB, partial [Bacteroidota bacterium]|nr:chemotaxis protein CheB [Bacteroidota bacterium]